MNCAFALRRRFLGGIASFILLCLGAPSAIGTPITYVFSGSATGTLGATPFTGAQVTVTGIADTVNITTFGGFAFIPCINLTKVTVNITGVGSATATGPNLMFDNQEVGVWGLNGGICVGGGGDWLDVTNALASTYGLVTAIGPSTGTPFVGGSIPTTAGTLTLTVVPPTFQAILGTAAAAPIPTLNGWGLLLLGIVLTGVAAFFLRGRMRSSR